MRKQHKQSGVTLVELVFGISVAATLASISLPMLGSVMHGTQARAARGMLTASLALARSSAASRGAHVLVCPSRDQARCADDIWWQHGWIVFVDANQNGLRDAGEELIEVVAEQRGTAIATSNGRLHTGYRGDGSAVGSNLTFTLCDRRGVTRATTIVISNSGRIRDGVPTPAQAGAACAAL